MFLQVSFEKLNFWLSVLSNLTTNITKSSDFNLIMNTNFKSFISLDYCFILVEENGEKDKNEKKSETRKLMFNIGIFFGGLVLIEIRNILNKTV